MRNFIVVGIVIPALVTGTTRHVYESDGAQGIQDSINVSNAYDTVMVHTGTYYAGDVDTLGITMKDSVALISPSPDSVILKGLNSAGTDTAQHVIYCNFGDSSSHSALIFGFTITGGYALSSPYGGGGIYCNLSSPTIEWNVIVNNRGFRGGGICCDSSSPLILKNTIVDNYGARGGGISCWYSSPTIVYNNISGDSTELVGGGIMCFMSSAIIEDNTITNNLAVSGGGIGCWDNSFADIRRNTIMGNLAYKGGGGIYHESSSSIIEHTIIANNLAEFYGYGQGGGIYCEDPCFVSISHSLIAGNIARTEGGALFADQSGSKISVDSSFIVDNGSIYSAYGPGGSGLACFYLGADTLRIHNSHLYYNTFQPDTEIENRTYIQIPVMNNFWWDTIPEAIEYRFKGPHWFVPFMRDFVPGVPCEPIIIDSIRNYDSTYSFIVDSLEDDLSPLYLKIYGEDRNPGFREAAVAIIKSSVYPGGIAVALVETDINSGVYQGKASIKVSTGNDTIRLDDIYNIVKGRAECDTITIVANIDTTQKFVVYYKCGFGTEENRKPTIENRKLEVWPNPVSRSCVIRYWVPPSQGQETFSTVYLRIYDLAGRLVCTLLSGKVAGGYYTIKWDERDDFGNLLESGVYFCRLEVGGCVRVKKFTILE